ncbi:receptor-like protein 9DC3 [Gossypium arboreum]|uniref:receptor-like protein 9DC3 n=1 Tax=Gossypium arboreum TaxID=29729 RepID=UPI0022F18D10|nr:receptor-like protein 9DC3 [Gossypium arboreum]
MVSYLFLSLFLFFPHLYASFSSSVSHSCSSLIQFNNSFSIAKDASFLCNGIAGLKSYPKTNSWKKGKDCCLWDEVTCDHLNAHMIALDLSCSSIPDEVAAFLDLILLDLSNNLFNGTLPSWLYTAPTLKEIDLSQNQINGHIKEFQSKSLESIWLENNKLQGLLPSSIFQLLNLIGLSLSSNNLSGVIELNMFSNLPNLKYVDLSYNSLSLTSNSTSTVNLTSLLLSSCNLSEFLQFLKGLKSSDWLDLSYNRIEGKIPQWMQEVGIDSLRYLNVSHNSLTEVEQFPWKNIAFLDLSSDLIRENLPILASTVNIFLISNNSFNGEVSSLICNASALQILDLSHNNLSRTIPQCFGNLSNSLEFLNLKKNKFYGTIPPTFVKGCQLSNFNLNGNLLEGPLTPSILNCKGLEVLDLGNNKINDTFPHWLGSLPQLQVLVLKSNHMHVRYINSFKAMINLEKIGSTMSYMRMYDQSAFYTYSIGIVTKGQDMELVKIFNMWMIIDLSNNQFEGGNLTSLEWLDLSSNKLSGTIPNRLAELAYLSSLNVSKNQLHGQIPQGKQFNTFGNDSCEGKKGLCGFLVSKGCNIIEPPPPSVLEKDGSKSNIGFG